MNDTLTNVKVEILGEFSKVVANRVGGSRSSPKHGTTDFGVQITGSSRPVYYIYSLSTRFFRNEDLTQNRIANLIAVSEAIQKFNPDPNSTNVVTSLKNLSNLVEKYRIVNATLSVKFAAVHSRSHSEHAFNKAQAIIQKAISEVSTAEAPPTYEQDAAFRR